MRIFEQPGLDQQFCRQFHVCPAACSNGNGQLWISNKTDLSVLNFVAYKLGTAIVPQHLSDEELSLKIDECFDTPSPVEETSRRSRDVVYRAVDENTDGKIVSQLNRIISDCIHQLSSDIHFEPYEEYLLCRARIDGVLAELKSVPLESAPEMISRIKIMSGLDIAEKRRPQDGRIRFSVDNRLVDIRVSIIPTEFGEKAVLRILDKQSLRLNLKDLGFAPEQYQLFLDKISLPNGIILVTGPTGSGKTTTLYAALQYLKSPEVNITTVEDPIEYNLEGINQTQVKPEINLTFSGMLRSILRQDPNIIMIGEIRDRETLDIAIRASLTGHLVFSTVHTNNAVATVTRLLDMGAESYLLGSSMKLIVAQRLVRKLCPACLTDQLDGTYRLAADRLGIELNSGARSSQGCSECSRSGFAGRTAVYELLGVDETLAKAIGEGQPEHELLSMAKEKGFRTMASSAADLVNSGITSPVEVLRELSS